MSRATVDSLVKVANELEAIVKRQRQDLEIAHHEIKRLRSAIPATPKPKAWTVVRITELMRRVEGLSLANYRTLTSRVAEMAPAVDGTIDFQKLTPDQLTETQALVSSLPPGRKWSKAKVAQLVARVDASLPNRRAAAYEIAGPEGFEYDAVRLRTLEEVEALLR